MIYGQPIRQRGLRDSYYRRVCSFGDLFALDWVGGFGGSESEREMMDRGYQLKRPCKNCPFAPTKTRIKFSCRERAEEIAESAYRSGFPCHLSAINTADDDDECGEGGYVFGENTQHCVGAIMMFLSDGNDTGWPGIYNDDELAERLNDHVDWTAPHYETEEDFIEANTDARKERRKYA